MTFVNTEAAYRSHRADLVRFATALVGPDDAQDVVNDAVASTLASGRLSEVHDLRAYWFRAVANRAASWHRATSRRRLREYRGSKSPPDCEDRPMTADTARHLLSRLTPQQRAVVYLTYWHDWDAATVAYHLDVSEGTVRKQLARGRAHLREVMTFEH